jgi:hypothetical protein
MNDEDQYTNEDQYTDPGFSEFNKTAGTCPYCQQHLPTKTSPDQMMRHYKRKCSMTSGSAA